MTKQVLRCLCSVATTACKQESKKYSDGVPDEVPPVGEVGMKCDGVMAIDDVESGVNAPQKIIGERCDDRSEVPPDSSKDD
jgi:hypothetical protein